MLTKHHVWQINDAGDLLACLPPDPSPSPRSIPCYDTVLPLNPEHLAPNQQSGAWCTLLW